MGGSRLGCVLLHAGVHLAGPGAVASYELTPGSLAAPRSYGSLALEAATQLLLVGGWGGGWGVWLL